MLIYFASDHAGFELKEKLKRFLAGFGYEIKDFGPVEYNEADDYPDFADAVAQEVLSGDAGRGVLVCGSGVGACVAANKVPGIRAGLCHDTYSAHQGVEQKERQTSL